MAARRASGTKARVAPLEDYPTCAQDESAGRPLEGRPATYAVAGSQSGSRPGQPAVRAAPTGQLRPLGPWLQ